MTPAPPTPKSNMRRLRMNLSGVDLYSMNHTLGSIPRTTELGSLSDTRFLSATLKQTAQHNKHRSQHIRMEGLHPTESVRPVF